MGDALAGEFGAREARTALRDKLGAIPLEIEIKLRVADLNAIREKLARLKAQPVRPRVHEMNALYDTRGGALARGAQMLRIRVERDASGRGKLGKKAGADAGTDAGKTVTLTYKGPVKGSENTGQSASQGASSRAGRGNARAGRQAADKVARSFGDKYKGAQRNAGPGERYKVREEREVGASDDGAIAEILAALGLAPRFRYEKFRSTYRLPGIAHVVVELDETPIGDFLELEGRREAIDRAAARLGFGRADYITESYGALYAERCGGARAALQNGTGGLLPAAEMLFRRGQSPQRKKKSSADSSKARSVPGI